MFFVIIFIEGEFMKDNKKMIVILASAVGVILLIIIVLMLIAGSGNKSLSYSQIEERVVSAGKNYFADHKDELPEVGTKTISANKLTDEGYLIDISKRVKGDATCDGTLYVTKTANDYSYRATLDCGSDYSTKTLKSVVMNNSVVTSGNGLYQETQVNPNNINETQTVYLFKGDNVNNYVKVGDYLWQIVKVFEDGTMEVLGDPQLLISTWDNRYNINTDLYDGINNYNVSRIHDFIVSDVVNDKDGFLKIKSLITTHSACVGKRSLDIDINDGSIECSEILENQYFSLLPVYDFMNASLDNNCNKALDDSCYNYNYLTEYSSSWWTITGVADETDKVYYVSNILDIGAANRSRSGRLMAYFDASVTYVSGSGTYDDPYIVK